MSDSDERVCDCCGGGPDECPQLTGASATCAGGDCACFHLSAVECSERLLRWITQNVYRTPIDDFRVALGAVWLSFCFDHDLNPFVELHSVLETFPFGPALGTVVPEWARSATPHPALPPSEKERG